MNTMQRTPPISRRPGSQVRDFVKLMPFGTPEQVIQQVREMDQELDLGAFITHFRDVFSLPRRVQRLPGKELKARMMKALATFLLGGLLGRPALAMPSSNAVSNPVAAVSGAGDWPGYGRTADEQRFSPLHAIDSASVGRLGLAWSHEFDTARGQEATPLAVGGVLYTTTAWSKVFALDAASGRVLWQYDPQIDKQAGFRACCDVVNRGAAYADGRIFVGLLDGRLVALDANTGRLDWSVVTVNLAKPYTITGAPRMAHGRVLIGNAGGEYGVRGYLSAYDARTGKLDWRFYTVPPAPGAAPDGAASDAILAKLAAHMSGEWWKYGGGGTVWDSIVYDAAYNQILFGTGNGSPWVKGLRASGHGDNPLLSAIIAVDADTGAYRWHYQGTPDDQWDYDQTESIVLADLNISGQSRHVALQAPKNGFFYVIDRKDGHVLSAGSYVPQTWTTGLDRATDKPREVPASDYAQHAFVAQPSGLGGHNWQPMAFSPATGLAYIPAQDVPALYQMAHPFVPRSGGWNLGVDFAAAIIPDDAAGLKAIRAVLKGHLSAWNPVAQKEVWRVSQDGPWNGGVLATAGGLIFQGDARGRFSAYDAKTGARAWSFESGIGIMAPPMTFEARGTQYVAIMAGFGGAYGVSSGFTDLAGPRPNGRLLVFALDRHAPYRIEVPPLRPVMDVHGDWTPASLARGRDIYENDCAMCHGGAARSSGVLPDLRRAPALASQAAWKAITIGGVLRDAGMVSFRQWLTEADAEAVRGYVAGRARAASLGQ